MDPIETPFKEFELLGHDRGEYYYLPKGSGQVVALKSRSHVEGELIAIAPRHFWEQTFGGKQGVDWKSAQNALIRRQQSVGIYDPSRIRGRGAWWDKDHAVLHLGDRLIIKGEEFSPSQPGRYIYEHDLPFSINHKNPLPVSQSRKLLDICELISWERPISARYFAGWLALAPICGALNWRPHIWLTAAADSGKSWVREHVMHPIIGRMSIEAQGNTTEPALRQSLKSDARPIEFDEAESKTKMDHIRMDSVLGFARHATTGAPIVKGGQDGNARPYFPRTMMCFFSISYGVTKDEDRRRIECLAMVRDHNEERFKSLSSQVAETITEEYGDAFLARSIKMIPVIRENARVFGVAVASKLRSHGTGDQLGALLAGAWSLFSDKAVTPAEAISWIEKQDKAGAWVEQKAAHEDVDEKKCLERIMEHVVRMTVKSGSVERNVAELLEIVRDNDRMLGDISAAAATDVLARLGVKAGERTEDGETFPTVWISVSHTGIGAILKDTPWARNWAKILNRLPGSRLSDGGIRFGPVKKRAVEVVCLED